MRFFSVFSLLFCLTLFSACQPQEQRSSQQSGESPAPVIVVVNYPLEFIVNSLVGPEYKVLNPVPPDADPETWLPDDELAATIQKADLIIINGASFADWVKKLSLPRSKVLRTSLSIKDALITVPDFEVHSHGAEGAHSHAGTVAFFWLDPALMARQAEAIAERLISLQPEEQQAITDNLQELNQSLAPLNQKLDQLKANYSGLNWLSRRPVYQYLAQRCGWTMYHTHWKPGQQLTEKEANQLKSLKKEHKFAGFLWERNPDAERVEKLKQEGLLSCVLNPLTTRPQEGDYVSDMLKQLTQLEDFLKSSQPTATGTTESK